MAAFTAMISHSRNLNILTDVTAGTRYIILKSTHSIFRALVRGVAGDALKYAVRRVDHLIILLVMLDQPATGSNIRSSGGHIQRLGRRI